MLTIPEIDEIAKRATERIAKEFAESGFANPPVVTHGIARAVLEAAEQKRVPDVCHKSPSKTHSWYGSSQGYVCEHCGTRR
jgi:hypothetical protein